MRKIIKLSLKVQTVYFLNNQNEMELFYMSEQKRISIPQVEELFKAKNIDYKMILRITTNNEVVEIPQDYFNDLLNNRNKTLNEEEGE